MVKLVTTPGLGPGAERLGGSSPSTRTNLRCRERGGSSPSWGTTQYRVMIKSYCISGDSWGCGEWQLHATNFPGGKQYDLHRHLLMANHIVSDISLPSEHNLYTISMLTQHLENSPIEFDYVIWFQSDPLRRPSFVSDLVAASNFSLDYNWFINKSNEYLDEEYAQLNSIGKTIYCIGGISKLNTKLLSKYANLNPLIVSFPEFLMPDLPHPNLCIGDWMNYIERQVKLDELDKINHDHFIMNKWASEECSEFFNFRDSHPNNKAYGLLAQFITINIGRVAESGLLHQT